MARRTPTHQHSKPTPKRWLLRVGMFVVFLFASYGAPAQTGVDWYDTNRGSPWTARYAHTSVAHDGKIWVIGGYGDGGRRNDVRSSMDGIIWAEATSSAPWTARSGHTSVVHDGKIWVIGGYDGSYLNDGSAIGRRAFIRSGVCAATGAAVIVSAPAHGEPQKMTPTDRMIIEHDCAKLINRFHHLFNTDLSLVADSKIFTKDATLDLGWFEVGPGPDAMRAPLSARAAALQAEGRVVLNIVSNVLVDVINANHARGVSTDTEWRHVSGDEEVALPPPVPLPTYLGYWTDEFQREDGQWKFARRSVRYTFDQQRWAESTRADYPEELVTSHEEWLRQQPTESK